jgi:hypothetical protein
MSEARSQARSQAKSEAMSDTAPFPPRLILAGAMVSGILLALSIHMIAQRFGLDLGALWRSDLGDMIPATAALAWWLVAFGAFIGGYVTASLMNSAASGQLPPRLRQFLIAIVVLLLAASGQAASAPSNGPTGTVVIGGLVALCLGGAMAFCGSYFALRRN